MSRAALVYEAGLFPGDDQQFNRHWSGQAGTKADVVSANGIYYTGACYFLGAMITANVTVNINIHDGTSNTTSKKSIIPNTATIQDGSKWMLPVAMPFSNGVYVEYQGAAAGNIVPIIVGT